MLRHSLFSTQTRNSLTVEYILNLIKLKYLNNISCPPRIRNHIGVHENSRVKYFQQLIAQFFDVISLKLPIARCSPNMHHLFACK